MADEQELQEQEAQAQPEQQAEPEQQEEQKVSKEDEREAREMGWRPKEEWKGDADKWRPADEFVRRGREVLPIVNARLRRENEAKDAEIARIRKESDERFTRLERMSRTALEKQRERLIHEFEAKKEQAVEAGDKDFYRAVQKEERETLKRFDDAADEAGKKDDKSDKPGLPRSVQDTLDSWVADNQWFQSDPELNAVANSAHERLLREKPGLTLAQNLAEVRAYVEKRYPDKFGKSDDDDDARPARRGSPVEGGTRLSGGSDKGKWSKVPADDRKMAESHGHIELYLGKGETLEKHGSLARERWATAYFGE